MPIEVVARGERWLSWRRAGAGLLDCHSHALRTDAGVWICDPLDGGNLDAELATLGELAGVLVLCNRHARAADRIAARHGVHVWTGQPADVPFTLLPVRRDPHWREDALWWADERLLVVAESIGQAPYFCARRAEPVAAHPFARRHPFGWAEGLEPELLLLGHGAPVTTGAAEALRTAAQHARSDRTRYALTRAVPNVLRGGWSALSPRRSLGC